MTSKRIFYYTNRVFEAAFFVYAPDKKTAHTRIADFVYKQYEAIQPVQVEEWEVTEFVMTEEPEVRMVRTSE